MKRLLEGFGAIVIICLIFFLWGQTLDKKASSGTNSKKVLSLFNWGDYIDPDLITKFEKETGYHVILETYDSNETMIQKIRQGGNNYDLAVPSEYTVEKMKKMNLIEPIDVNKIHNIGQIDPFLMNRNIKTHYSIPYFWGTLGIVYNDKYIKEQDINHWRDLWSSKFKNDILLIDSVRDVFAVSLISQHQSINSTNEQVLQNAKKHLDELSPNVKAIVADEIKMYMEQEEAYLAVDWSGEAKEMMSVNSHLHYLIPSEGSNVWIDNFVIPKTAKHYKAIYKFLNFMNEPKNAAQNARYVGYSTPNLGAKKLLPKSVTDDHSFYPNKITMKHLASFRDLGQKKVEEYNDLFLEFKMFR